MIHATRNYWILLYLKTTEDSSNELWLIMTTSRRRLFVHLMKEIISCCQCCMEWKDDELRIIVSVYLSTLSQASCLDLEESDGEFHSLSQLCQEGIGEHWQINSYLYKLLYIITNTKIKVVISQYVLQTISYVPNHGVSMILCQYIFHRGYNRLHV